MNKLMLKKEEDTYNKERLVWCIEMIGYDIFGVAYLLISTIQAFSSQYNLSFAISVYFLNFSFIDSVMSLSNIITDYVKYRESRTIIENLLSSDTRIKTNSLQLDKEIDIEVSNLVYTVDNRKIIKDISFSLKHGSKMLLLGENGSGKSTFLKLLTGGSLSYNGSITYNAQEVSNIPYDVLSNYTTYFTNKPLVFEALLTEDLNYFLSDYENNRLDFETLASEFNIFVNEHISEAIISRNGEFQYSLGQMQRLMFIIMVLRNRPINIVDEGLSNLDDQMLKVILNKMRKLEGTCIVCAHNFPKNLYKYFDHIVQIASGRLEVMQGGDYDE